MSETTTASQSPEELVEALQNGELSSLMDRVKEAQTKIAELRDQQPEQASNNLHAHEVAGINSLIIHDLLDIRNSGASPQMAQMIDAVLTAAIAQHGRMLDVHFQKSE